MLGIGALETGGGANWSQSYSYDTVGNRWIVPTQNTGLPAPTLETPQAQSWYSTTVPNRIASWSYDPNGNVLQIGNYGSELHSTTRKTGR